MYFLSIWWLLWSKFVTTNKSVFSHCRLTLKLQKVGQSAIFKILKHMTGKKEYKRSLWVERLWWSQSAIMCLIYVCHVHWVDSLFICSWTSGGCTVFIMHWYIYITLHAHMHFQYCNTHLLHAPTYPPQPVTSCITTTFAEWGQSEKLWIGERSCLEHLAISSFI